MIVCKNTVCQNKSALFETTDAPVESLMEFGEIANLLAEMAKTGMRNFVFKDANLNKLAELIVTLSAENNYLKKLAAVLSPVLTTRTEKDVVINFGPDGVYALAIPVATDEQRRSLAVQFLTLAQQLDPQAKPDARQLQLF